MVLPVLILGLLFHRGAVSPVQPITPESRQRQLPVMTLAIPGSYFDPTTGWSMVSHVVESRQQVIICGHHHTDVVGSFECESYKVNGQGNIDAPLLSLTL